jgi:hypothetical protein
VILILDRATEKAPPETGMTAAGLFYEILIEGGSRPAKILKEEFSLHLPDIAQSWAKNHSRMQSTAKRSSS